MVRDAETRARLSRVHQWAGMCARAPLVIAVLGRPDSTWWIEDCSAATENVLLEAQSLGLGAVWVGIRDEATEGYGDERRVLEILGAPGRRLALPVPDSGRASRRDQGATHPAAGEQALVRALRPALALTG